jgi:hypothetical protein
MFRSIFLIWLVLVVLTLNAVAFVTRFVEKHRAVDDSSESPERTVSVIRSSELSISKHQQNQRHQRTHR